MRAQKLALKLNFLNRKNTEASTRLKIRLTSRNPWKEEVEYLSKRNYEISAILNLVLMSKHILFFR